MGAYNLSRAGPTILPEKNTPSSAFLDALHIGNDALLLGANNALLQLALGLFVNLLTLYVFV